MSKELVMYAVPAALLTTMAIGIFVKGRWVVHIFHALLSLSLLWLVAVVVFA